MPSSIKIKKDIKNLEKRTKNKFFHLKSFLSKDITKKMEKELVKTLN